jgi:uncharacterized protein (TIGR00369 family)
LNDIPLNQEKPRFENAPISQLIGLQIEPGEPGAATVHLPLSEAFHNPMGRVHGGVYAVLADAAMGIAFGRTLSDKQDFATLDLHLHFIRAARGPSITARASVRQRGINIGFIDCDIVDQRGKLVATATCSCTILNPDGSS